MPQWSPRSTENEARKQSLAVMTGLSVFVDGKIDVPRGDRGGVRIRLGDHGVSLFRCEVA